MGGLRIHHLSAFVKWVTDRTVRWCGGNRGMRQRRLGLYSRLSFWVPLVSQFCKIKKKKKRNNPGWAEPMFKIFAGYSINLKPFLNPEARCASWAKFYNHEQIEVFLFFFVSLVRLLLLLEVSWMIHKSVPT